MRIISGAARGHRLKTPSGITRPATDRTREAVFSMIGDIVKDARILDLFCGTGAYGLEALSRGGRHAHFVDQSRQVELAIQSNVDHPAFAKHSTIHCRQAGSSLDLFGRTPEKVFDLVFADPPYELSRDWPSLQAVLPFESLLPLIAPRGLFVLERSSGSEDLEQSATATGLEMLTSRCYGNSRIEIFRPA